MISSHRVITGFVKHKTAVATLQARAAATRDNLYRLRSAILDLLRDENFVNLLRAEGLVTIPASINTDDTTGLKPGQTGARPGNSAGLCEASLGQWKTLRQHSQRLRKQLGKEAGVILEESLRFTTLFCYLKSLVKAPFVRKYLSKHDPDSLHNLQSLAATLHQLTADQGGAMNDALWTLAKAKADLQQLMRAAVKEGPQAICIGGIPSVMVVSIRTWNALNQKDTAQRPTRGLRSTRKKCS
jgi:hypothetical protein